MPATPQAKPDAKDEDSHSESECAAVKLWQGRVSTAKKRWMPEFKRMKKNMAFACGYQRPGQKILDTEKYVTNITLRVLLEKMAILYARNPKAEWQRRPRLDFQLWDGKIETLRNAAMQMQLTSMQGMPPNMQQVALMMDVVHGRQQQDMIERVGKTLQYTYAWQLLEQEPDFKDSMKDLVLRALVCGVGYVRLAFERDFTSSIASMDNHSKIGDRARRFQHIMDELGDKDFDPTDARMEELVQLTQSMAQSVASGELQDLSERLVFDFPEPSSIIPDVKCRNLKTFDGARWVAGEYIRPLDEVNEFFETDIPPSGELKFYDESGREQATPEGEGKDVQRSPNICIWEIFDLKTKSTFFVADGYKYYVQKPGAVEPSTRRFWPWYGLVFNKVVVEPGLEQATCFPPSDVDLIKHAQKEWNRTREELRSHRKQNRPLYGSRADKLTEEDKNKLQNHESGDCIEFQGMQQGDKLADLIQPVQTLPIQPQLYDTTGLEHDILMAVGAQQADVGPVARTTATESSIAEHSKMSTNSSNVDELDDLLSALAKSGGEIILREMSPETVKKIAGVGAVFPTDPESRENFLNEIFLDTKAASSGRPNKALELSNIQIIAPLLMQAGANPAAVVEELVRRLDDQIDVSRFLPIMPPTPPAGQEQQQGRPGPGQPGKKPAKKSGPPQAGRPPMMNAPSSRPTLSG